MRRPEDPSGGSIWSPVRDLGVAVLDEALPFVGGLAGRPHIGEGCW